MTIDHPLDDLVPLGDGPVATVLAGVAEDGQSAFALKVFPGPLPRRVRGELDRELARLRPLAGRAPLLVPDAVDALPDGRAVLRMALCTQSLTELVGSAGPLDGGDVLALGEAVAVALAALHGAGVVHGGVSPGNVLFGAEGEPLLADAGTVLREAFAGDAGPPGYRAPETLREAVVDERTDLYGLGAMLHFALTGHPPHGEQPSGDPAGYVLRILNEPVPRPARPDVPPELLDLVGALLSADPAGRPIDAAYVADRLATAGTAPVPAAAPPSERALVAVAGAPARPKSSGRIGLLIAVPVMIAVVVAVAVILLRDEPAPLVPPAGPPPAPVPTAAPPAALVLDAPADQGATVELTWHADGAQLQFAVVVAAEGAPSVTRFTGQERTLREPVTPGLKYCFLVQATDGVHTFQSASRPIRGATCNR
ncbi:serine/threonine-protein kinase [Amycolatopsis sp. NPDC051758]|uniref:serine/threonine-protein kinase n=1 Tax=Amycolatopsis sp. NPDC051758 TaxID=3363935 RepID=UPI0037AC2031